MGYINTLENRDILSASDFEKEDLELILRLSSEMEKRVKERNVPQLLSSYILASLFFESSTRTRLSFETAMLRLGGQVITVEQGASSSIKKGESLHDTAKVVGSYVDVIAVRHPEPYSASIMADASDAVVINAGDGPHEHPTQALLDLYTIFTEKQKIDGLKIGFLGDLRYGRTVHSLIKVLKHYNIECYLISPKEVTIPTQYLEILQENNCKAIQTEEIEEVLPELDVLYATRIQEERFKERSLYNRIKDNYHLNSSLLKKSKKDLTLLHPLPRVQELDTDLDIDPKARYFKQATNGVYVRMALLSLVLGKNIL